MTAFSLHTPLFRNFSLPVKRFVSVLISLSAKCYQSEKDGIISLISQPNFSTFCFKNMIISSAECMHHGVEGTDAAFMNALLSDDDFSEKMIPIKINGVPDDGSIYLKYVTETLRKMASLHRERDFIFNPTRDIYKNSRKRYLI